MNEADRRPFMQGCGKEINAATSIDALNSTCFCLSLDEAALRRGLESDLGARGPSNAMVRTHPMPLS